MNPVDNNTNINPGAGAASDGFGPAPAGGAGGPSGFSAGDTLGVAKDNDSSAAKPEGGNTAGSSSSSMTMDEAPETPFVPASPAPGSIGSVTSGPAAGSTNLAAAVAPSGADGSAAFAPVNDANPTMPPVSSNNDLLAQAANETPAASPAFNPFAPAGSTTTNNATTPGATVASNAAGAGAQANASAAPGQTATMPSPFQAKMDNLAAKAAKTGGGSSNILTIIFAVVGAIAIIAAIVFCVLWRQSVSNPEIRYISAPTANGDSANANSVVTCSRMYGAGEVAGMENLVNEEASLTLDFANDEWQTSGLYAVYNFTDAGAAEAANAGIFAAMTSSLSLNSDSGEAIVSTSSQALDNRVEYREDTDISLMSSNMADGRDIPRTEDGSIQKNRADVQAYYESQGWTCK